MGHRNSSWKIVLHEFCVYYLYVSCGKREIETQAYGNAAVSWVRNVFRVSKIHRYLTVVIQPIRRNSKKKTKKMKNALIVTPESGRFFHEL